MDSRLVLKMCHLGISESRSLPQRRSQYYSYLHIQKVWRMKKKNHILPTLSPLHAGKTLCKWARLSDCWFCRSVYVCVCDSGRGLQIYRFFRCHTYSCTVTFSLWDLRRIKALSHCIAHLPGFWPLRSTSLHQIIMIVLWLWCLQCSEGCWLMPVIQMLFVQVILDLLQRTVVSDKSKQQITIHYNKWSPSCGDIMFPYPAPSRSVL